MLSTDISIDRVAVSKTGVRSFSSFRLSRSSFFSSPSPVSLRSVSVLVPSPEALLHTCARLSHGAGPQTRRAPPPSGQLLPCPTRTSTRSESAARRPLSWLPRSGLCNNGRACPSSLLVRALHSTLEVPDVPTSRWSLCLQSLHFDHDNLHVTATLSTPHLECRGPRDDLLRQVLVVPTNKQRFQLDPSMTGCWPRGFSHFPLR